MHAWVKRLFEYQQKTAKANKGDICTTAWRPVRTVLTCNLLLSESSQKRHVPRLLGSCFGSQTLAHSLGGLTTKDPHGRITLGPETLEVTDAFEPFCKRLGLVPVAVAEQKQSVKQAAAADGKDGKAEAKTEAAVSSRAAPTSVGAMLQFLAGGPGAETPVYTGKGTMTVIESHGDMIRNIPEST